MGDSDVGRMHGGQLVAAAEGLAAWLGAGSTRPPLCVKEEGTLTRSVTGLTAKGGGLFSAAGESP